MKHSIILCSLLLVFSFYGCKKDKTISGFSANSKTFLDSAVQYLRSNLLEKDFNKLDLTRNAIMVYTSEDLAAQIFEKGDNGNKFLLLQSKNSNYTGNWVDISNLTKVSSKHANGNIILSNLDNSSVTTLVVENNEVIRTEKISGNNLTAAITYFNNKQRSPIPYSGSSPDLADPMLPPVVIYYDVNAGPNGAGIDYLSWYWLVDQTSAGSYAYFPSSGGGGGGNGSTGNSGNVAFAPLTLSPDAPIADVKQELKCFTNNSTATYTISVNVNEPDPGTREVVDPFSSFPVGHTFLTLEQDNADGTSIIRTVGFYPKNSVKPGSEKDQSIFGNDSNTPFDVSLNFTVSADQLNKVASTLENQQALQYDLDNFNCTNSAMDALKAININLPDTKSDEPLFSGNDPGDLGEDIRGLNLNTFSSENGNIKVVRTVSNSNNQYPNPRTGSCP
jgi:hypothetical protein